MSRRSARARYIVLGETTHFRIVHIYDDEGNRVGYVTQQRIIVRDEHGVSRRAYRTVAE
jgi:hypothetical protein